MGEGSETPVISWFDEPIRKSVNSVFSGLNSAVEALDLFNRYRDSHFKMLWEAVGKVKVLGMASPMQLSDFYFPAQVSSDIKRRLYQEEWLQPSGPQASSKTQRLRAVDGTAYVEKSDRLVVLGGPGAGKTTFLKHLALSYSKKEIFESTKLVSSKLPFYVSLPDFSKFEGDLFDFICAPLVKREDPHAKAFITRAVRKGLVAILLDSLDEVPLSTRNQVTAKIRELAATYPEAKIVVSCRTADYTDVLSAFDEVELVRLSADAVKKIVKSWFANDRKAAEELVQLIQADSGLAGLTETPLLLSLLCIQFKHDLQLPRRRVEVYKRCVETLLRDWDTSRGFRRSTAYESLSDDHKERLFEHVAGTSLHSDQAYVIPKKKLCELTSSYIRKLGLESEDAEGVISEIERHHGIIEQHAMEAFCFSHASIHDYFAARYALHQRKDMEWVKTRLEAESWAGVIEFICGLHPNPEPIFDLMAQKAGLASLRNFPAVERRAKLLYLIYRCLAVGPILEPEKAAEISDHIANSIVAFTAVLAEAKVYPMCALNGQGVRHPYFFTGVRRPTLQSTLLPFRRLTNEILMSPIQRYAKTALGRADKIAEKGLGNLSELSAYMNLVVPLAKADPVAVMERLEIARSMSSGQWLNQIIDESLSVIRQ
ncbi:MAG: NACHT domain-containing protein [Rhizobium sp.]|nr:NACHT domain-containing protein [Rhizobium sp.]